MVSKSDCRIAHAMCSSYNLINGTFSCENDYTMNTILKGELNFQGLCVVA